MKFKRSAAAIVAVSVAAALAVGVAPQLAEAAASVSIAGVAKTNAPDIKSKGIIRTPVVETPGNSAVVSRSYVITKGKNVVARTSSQSKAYKLGVGTYQVKTTVKYRNFTEKDQYRKVTERQVVGYKERQIEHTDLISDGYEDTATLDIGSTRDCTVTLVNPWTDPEYASIIEFNCTDKENQDGYKGASFVTQSSAWVNSRFKVGMVFVPQPYFGPGVPQGSMVMSGVPIPYEPARTFWHEPEYYTWYETVYDEVWDSYTWDEWIGTTRTYGAPRTVTKTQSVKISNSGTMTLYEYKKIKNKMRLSKVKSVVGGTGKVVDRWSWGSDDYVIRVFNGHAIYFKNGKVDSKYWNW